MLEDEDPGTHKLALGNTRPPLFPFLNMPWMDFCVFIIGFMFFLFNFWPLCIPIALAFAGAIIIYRKDYFAGRKLICWLITSARHLGAAKVGGTYITPSAVYARGIYRGTIR